MQQIATVSEVSREIATVCVERSDACANCHAACVGCKKLLQAKARNTAGAKAGDRVLLESKTGRLLGVAACVFLLPLLLAGGTLLLGRGLSFPELPTNLCAVGIGILTFFLSAFGWNRALQRKPDLQIIEIIESHQAENGDIDV